MHTFTNTTRICVLVMAD